MPDTISIAVTADVSALEAAMEAAAATVNETAASFATGFQRAGLASQKFAAQIVRDQKQANEKLIAGEAQKNAFLLEMGEESLDQFVAQAKKLENQRYQIELDALRRKEASDSDNKATLTKDLAEEQVLYQEHVNRLQKIDEEYARKKRAADDKSFAEFEKTQESEVKSVLDANAEKFKAGNIAASEQEQLDLAALDSAKASVDQQFAALTTGWDKASAAYKTELEKRAAFDAWYAEQRKRVEDRSAVEEAQTWARANSAIASAEDSLIRDIFTKRQSLGRDLLQITGQMLEREIASDVKYWTERELLAIEGVSAESATEKGGLLVHLLANTQKTASTATSQAAQTGAVAAGVAARTGIEAAGASASNAAEVKAGSASIMNDAYESAAAAFRSVMQSVPPPANLVLAPVAAAGTFAAVMAFDTLQSFDVGAWELPHDMPALLHKGEMVVPENFASGLRANAGSGAGDGVTFNTHYYPTINMRDPANLKELLQKGGSELFDAIQRGYRIGIPMRPSMTPGY